MNACTIIAKNYIAYARVLAASFHRHHPGGRFSVLVIDDFAGYIDPARESFEVLTPADVGCTHFVEMALRYSVLELSTAVKPWLLRHLLEQTGGPVTYLDPDIRVFAPLTRIDDLAREHGLVLTPHNSRPVPADGRRPSQVDIMIAGVYNLGFVSLAPRQEIEDLLDWWADRLLRDCRVDPIWGYFVDQRWFDLAPGLVSDLAILRDPEFNVAYWNLHSRRLAADDGTYTVDGRPLAFFHFSGFDPEHPLVLSRHQDRIDVSADPVLERILAEYAADVQAEGHPLARRWPYSYNALGDGTTLDRGMRALFEAWMDEQMARGEPVTDPFAPDSARGFDGWVRSQAPGAAPGVSRALAHVYHARDDLRAAYPDLAGAGGLALILWAEEFGRREVPLLARVMRSDGEGAGPRSATAAGPEFTEPEGAVPPGETFPLATDVWGVNVVGRFRSSRSDGAMARGAVAALDAAGVQTLPLQAPFGPWDVDDVPYIAAELEDAPFPVNLVCLDAPGLLELVRDRGRGILAGRYTVGQWSWPVEVLAPEWAAALPLLQEFWTPSRHVTSLLTPLADSPVVTIPPVVDSTDQAVPVRSQIGLPEDCFVMVTTIDDESSPSAANTWEAIAAFRDAVRSDDQAVLVVHAQNLARYPRERDQLRDVAGPDIIVVDAEVDLPHLIAACDGVLSLHRVTAFGSGMAQAMWHAKPVIATGYSGNLDYMTGSNSYLVDYELVEVPADGTYPVGAHWAQPDLRSAVSRIREVLDDATRARRIGARGAAEIRRSHSSEAAGAVIARRLEEIRAVARARAPQDGVADLTPAVSDLPLRAREAMRRVAAPGRAQRARQLARKGVQQALWPVTRGQQAINEALIAAVLEVNHQIVQLRRDDAGKRAGLLAQLRFQERFAPLGEAQLERLGHIERLLTLETDRSVFLALDEMRRRHAEVRPEAGEPSADLSLSGYELRAFSQNGEDGVLAEILRRIGAPGRCFVEFGVESGREGNCVYLADVAGWSGMFLEPDEEHFARLQRKYSAQGSVVTLQAALTAENIDELFRQAEVPAEPDIVSIDVDGEDYWIWDGLTSFRPRIVVVEYNSALEPAAALVQPHEPGSVWDGTEHFGASLGALERLGQDKGYRLVHTELSGANAFFVRSDLADGRFPDPGDVPRRGEPNYFGRGYHHPPAPAGRRYLDVSADRLVSGARRVIRASG